jgi:hypothetical protein
LRRRETRFEEVHIRQRPDNEAPRGAGGGGNMTKQERIDLIAEIAADIEEINGGTHADNI